MIDSSTLLFAALPWLIRPPEMWPSSFETSVGVPWSDMIPFIGRIALNKGRLLPLFPAISSLYTFALQLQQVIIFVIRSPHSESVLSFAG